MLLILIWLGELSYILAPFFVAESACAITTTIIKGILYFLIGYTVPALNKVLLTKRAYQNIIGS
jgi:hypothetical protein